MNYRAFSINNLIFSILCILEIININVESKHYRAHDALPLIANTIGPFNNPTETYPVSLFLYYI